MESCALLSEFSRNRRGDSAEIIQNLMRLVQAGAILDIQLEGYFDCSLCQRAFDGRVQPAKLDCKHEVHMECLKSQALAMTNGTLDPSQMVNWICRTCLTPIQYSKFQRIVGLRWIESCQEGIARTMQINMQRQDRLDRQRRTDQLRYECAVCMNECAIDSIITFDCDHRFCKACCEQHIRTSLGLGKFRQEQIGCLQCGKGYVNEQTLRYCVGDEMTKRIINFRHKYLQVPGITIMGCKGYLQKNNNDLLPLLELKPNMTPQERKKFDENIETINRSIKRNQKPANIGEIEQCPGIISHLEGEIGQITCPVCLLKQCIKGCAVTHEGKTCEQYKASAKENEMQDGGIQILRQNGFRVVKCPNTKCNALINRVSGCDWVKCRCGCELCYICQVPWVGTCPHKNGHAPFDFATFMRNQG